MEDLHTVMHGPTIGMQCPLSKRATMTGQTIYEGITLHNGDCRDIMREMPADHFDAIITDPPYGIAFKGEKWDTATPRGFQSWCESWAVEALRIVKPGGYLLAFSAPRTYHRYRRRRLRNQGHNGVAPRRRESVGGRSVRDV